MRVHLRRLVRGLGLCFLVGYFILFVLLPDNDTGTTRTRMEFPNIHDQKIRGESAISLEEEKALIEEKKAQEVQALRLQALFPYKDEVNDRVIEQMNLELPVTENKTILLWHSEASYFPWLRS